MKTHLNSLNAGPNNIAGIFNNFIEVKKIILKTSKKKKKKKPNPHLKTYFYFSDIKKNKSRDKNKKILRETNSI